LLSWPWASAKRYVIAESVVTNSVRSGGSQPLSLMFKQKSRPKNQRKPDVTETEDTGNSTPLPDEQQASGSSTPAVR
jgi:hypothetical protein